MCDIGRIDKMYFVHEAGLEMWSPGTPAWTSGPTGSDTLNPQADGLITANELLLSRLTSENSNLTTNPRLFCFLKLIILIY